MIKFNLPKAGLLNKKRLSIFLSLLLFLLAIIVVLILFFNQFVPNLKNAKAADFTVSPTSGPTTGGTIVTFTGTGFGSFAGYRDTTFGTGTGPSGSVFSTVIQNDGKILIGGQFTTYNGININRVARLNTDGSLDTSFNIGTGANDFIRAVTIQNDGKILIGGNFTSYNGININRVARLNTDGSLDTSFNIGTGADGVVWSIELLSGGNVLVAGEFNNFNSTLTNKIIKLDSTGNIVDPNFSTNISATGEIFTTAVQSDGKIVVGKGTSLIRINNDGTIDSAFTPGTIAGTCCGANTNKIKIDSDGKIVVVGYFVTYNGVSKIDIVRLNTDGTIDSAFNAAASFTGVYDVFIQPDGKIILAGNFNQINGVNGINRLARLNSNGTLDTTFNVGGSGSNSGVFSLAVQPDGKILVSPSGNYNGAAVNQFIRVYGGALSATFDGLPATSVTLVNSTTITAVTPPHAAGLVNVTLTNGNSNVFTLNNGYTYTQPIQNANIDTLSCNPSPTLVNTTVNCIITTNVDISTLSGSVNVRIGALGTILNCPVTGSGTTLTCNSIPVGTSAGTFPAQFNASGSGSTFANGSDIVVTLPVVEIATPAITSLQSCTPAYPTPIVQGVDTVSCTFKLTDTATQNYVLPATTPLTFKVDNSIAEITCSQASSTDCAVDNINDTIIVSNIPTTQSSLGSQPVRVSDNNSTFTDYPNATFVIKNIANSDIQSLNCSPNNALINTNVNCTITTIADLANLTGSIDVKIGNLGTVINCPITGTGTSLSCSGVSAGSLIGTFPSLYKAASESNFNSGNNIIVSNPPISACTQLNPCALIDSSLTFSPTQDLAKRYGLSLGSGAEDLILNVKSPKLENVNFTSTCTIKYKFRTDTSYRVLETNAVYNPTTGCAATLSIANQLLFNVDFEITANTVNGLESKHYLLYSNYDFKAGSVGVTNIEGGPLD